jgi:uncharacterized protein YjaG (DUF416 family)
MLAFDENLLVASLGATSCRARTLFAALVATRLITAYEIFCGHSNQQSQPISAALDLLWSHISDGAELDFAELAEGVLAYSPKEEDCSLPLAAQAEDAVAALAYAFLTAESCDAQQAAWAARRSYEAADNIAISQLREGASEASILSQSIVQGELREQVRDFELAVRAEDDILALRAGARARSERFWNQI